MKLYLDPSCLNRPFDDQSQERVRLEGEAVRLIFARIDRGEWQHFSSEMTIMEIEANPDAAKRHRVQLLLPMERDIISLTEPILARAGELERSGLAAADAVHLAAAEALNVDVFLTCDDRLLRASRRCRLTIKVANPLVWLSEESNAPNA